MALSSLKRSRFSSRSSSRRWVVPASLLVQDSEVSFFVAAMSERAWCGTLPFSDIARCRRGTTREARSPCHATNGISILGRLIRTPWVCFLELEGGQRGDHGAGKGARLDL